MEVLKKFFHIVTKTFKWLLIVAVVLFLLLVLIGVFADDEELLEDAFVAPGISLKSATVKYVTKEGQEVSVPAYAGQIEILTSAEIDLEKVKKFISERGGKIIAQAPTVGIYIAEASSGEEAELIEVLLKEDWVIDAYPYTPLEKNQAEYILDFWGEPSRERSHGAAVCYYANGQKECTKEILDSCFEHKNCQEAEWPIFYQILREIKASEDAPFITINLSLGPKAKDENGKQLSIVAVQTMRKAFFAMLIQILGRDDVASVKKTIIINSAGNEGVDLTPIFQSLFSRKGFERLLLVGAITQAGKISSYSNYSQGERDIMYSVGGEKAIPMAEKNLTWTGTSFAAPQISCLLNNWLRESPKRATNPQKLRELVFDADVGKDTKRDFQYRYRIDPCLTKNQAEKPKKEPASEKPPSPSNITPSSKARPIKALSFSVPERLPSAQVGSDYLHSSFCDPIPGEYDSCGESNVTQINPTGGIPPYRFEIVGDIPEGISINGFHGSLGGMPLTKGEWAFDICAIDDSGTEACKRTALAVIESDNPLTLAIQDRIGPLKVGKGYYSYYSFAKSVIGGKPPYQFISDAPEGMYITLSGSLSGTPEIIGETSFKVCVYDDNNIKVCKDAILVVEPADVLPIPAPVPTLTPLPTPTPTPAPTEEAPYAKLTSKPCSLTSETHSPWQGDYYYYSAPVAGTMGGPEGAHIFFQTAGLARGYFDGKTDCGAWIKKDETPGSFRCERGAGQPALSNWGGTITVTDGPSPVTESWIYGEANYGKYYPDTSFHNEKICE